MERRSKEIDIRCLLCFARKCVAEISSGCQEKTKINDDDDDDNNNNNNNINATSKHIVAECEQEGILLDNINL